MLISSVYLQAMCNACIGKIVVTIVVTARFGCPTCNTTTLDSEVSSMPRSPKSKDLEQNYLLHKNEYAGAHPKGILYIFDVGLGHNTTTLQ